jgi:hypothetical protein
MTNDNYWCKNSPMPTGVFHPGLLVAGVHNEKAADSGMDDKYPSVAQLRYHQSHVVLLGNHAAKDALGHADDHRFPSRLVLMAVPNAKRVLSCHHCGLYLHDDCTNQEQLQQNSEHRNLDNHVPTFSSHSEIGHNGCLCMDLAY